MTTTAVEIAEGYDCGSYSYALVAADEATAAVTDTFTAAVSEEDESAVVISGLPQAPGALTFKLVATADDSDKVPEALRSIESGDVTLTVEMGGIVLPDNSDTQVLMIVIFGSVVGILIIVCLTAFIMGKCGKCQGDVDKTAVYNNTAKK